MMCQKTKLKAVITDRSHYFILLLGLWVKVNEILSSFKW